MEWQNTIPTLLPISLFSPLLRCRNFGLLLWLPRCCCCASTLDAHYPDTLQAFAQPTHLPSQRRLVVVGDPPPRQHKRRQARSCTHFNVSGCVAGSHAACYPIQQRTLGRLRDDPMKPLSPPQVAVRFRVTITPPRMGGGPCRGRQRGAHPSLPSEAAATTNWLFTFAPPLRPCNTQTTEKNAKKRSSAQARTTKPTTPSTSPPHTQRGESLRRVLV